MSLPFNIKFGTPLHDKVAQNCYERYVFSKRYMSRRYPKWTEAENKHMAYVPEDLTEATLKKRQKAGKQEYATLSIPYSYSMLLSAHTYWTTIFLSRDPILQFMGRHGESEMKTQAMESLMAYQTQVGKHLLPYYVWLYDVGKYGLGILGHYWEEEIVQASSIIEVPETYMGIPIEGKTKRQRVIRRVPGYQGTKLYNVRPFDFFPDPRVPLQRLQDGEFCGRATPVGWNTISKRQASGLYFNIDELKNRTRGDNLRNTEGSMNIQMPAQENAPQNPGRSSDHGYLEIMEMYVELVPKEWNLGTSDYPEKWVFTLADMRNNRPLVISAQPLGELHNKFPFSILECEVDGYALLKRGFYDVLEPLQNTMDWLFNSHFYNVRRSLNDSLVIDPSRVNTADFLQGEPGWLARLLPSAYGTDVRTVAHQFSIQDVTSGHLMEAQGIGQMMQRALGINDGIMGMLASAGGRRTATEVRQANTLGINRLKTQAEYFSACGWTPNAEMLTQTTQQHYSNEMNLRIAGDLLNSSGSLKVTPEMIAGFFDFVAVDGNMPIDRFAQVNLWTQLMGQMRQNPTVMATYDVAKMFAWIARLAGLKNIDQFKIKVQDDGALMKEAQKGNIVPLTGGVSTPDINFPENVALGG